MTYSNYINNTQCSHKYLDTYYCNNTGGVKDEGCNDTSGCNHDSGGYCNTDGRWCFDHSMYVCGHYNNYVDYNNYVNYNNHINTQVCRNLYSDHKNSSRNYPVGYTITDIKEIDIDNWTDLSSSIEDLQKIRDEINKLAEQKVKSNGTGFKANENPVNKENNAENFAAGQKARVEQINETITNMQTLWQRIKGSNTSGLTTKARYSRMKKQDYKDILRKANELAELTQRPENGYINHLNTGYNNPSLGYYANHTNSANSYINRANTATDP